MYGTFLYVNTVMVQNSEVISNTFIIMEFNAGGKYC